MGTEDIPNGFVGLKKNFLRDTVQVKRITHHQFKTCPKNNTPGIY